MKNNQLLGAGIILLLALLSMQFALGVPVGATLTSNTTDFGPSRAAAALTHNRSTITTVVLNALQQDAHWKAYVGNVTGSLTLQDSTNNTIYDWTALSVPTGEVYATRSNSVSFVSPACVDNTSVVAEQVVMNMSGTDVDSLNLTFNGSNHTTTLVGSTTLSGCRMTTLYVNNASQGQNNASANFQEFLMEDATNNLIYVSIINDNKPSYNGRTYDFQMLVAESNSQAASTYYFYMELG